MKTRWFCGLMNAEQVKKRFEKKSTYNGFCRLFLNQSQSGMGKYIDHIEFMSFSP